MAVENHQLEVYQKIWELIVNDPDFRTISGVTIGPNNRIRVDGGKVNPVKKTTAQDGDLPELAITFGELRDGGADGTEDRERPTFAEVEGDGCNVETIVEYDYVGTLTYPSKDFANYFPLVEVIRRNIRGYALRTAGLQYAGNTSVVAAFDPDAEWRDTKRPQHRIEITTRVLKN